MSPDEAVQFLQELFPDRTASVLAQVLRNANGDVDTACAMLVEREQATAGKAEQGRQWNLASLMEMFPKISSADIEQTYDACDGDTDLAAMSLLNFQGLSGEDARMQAEYERIVRQQPDVAGRPDSWQDLRRKVADIVKYTGVKEGQAKAAFFKNSCNAPAAVADIISSGVARSESTEQQSPVPAAVAVPGGRVQARAGLAHTVTYSSRPRPPAEAHAASDGLAMQRARYVYSPGSPEAIELAELVRANIQLASLSRELLQSALEYYAGDVTRTIETAAFIIGARPALREPKRRPATTRKVSQPRRPKRPAPPELRNSLFSSTEAYNRALELARAVHSSWRIDLHGFLVDDAEALSEYVLASWWQRERELRELHCQRMSQSLALNMPPLTVVTGRGLHSVGGVSRVRVRIQRLLDKQHYVYDEEPSYFIVKGRRPK
ncbi:ABR016Cp [Eremothecium gossypii ATCC 10895]|uniref:ABR016Cp n=1 Tax=Eremothecium gossypii (strain ATCC 10895 / CBS 109.51 / FGSC 9923 / NRRL Y-1056) TaxID=284811 RepID=Q75DK5_EREGS|nr:ABR016Cp [Eremothecium gossypii ATCC 10895]AAS50786.2 ABR016Cp [Eremothecium gossypii ATCC 10895]AEY95075.1 FABR016Cp [Eremothecium gossypii FDAG1]